MSLSESMATADPHVAVIARIGGGSQPDLAKLFDTTSQLIFALVVWMIGDRTAAEAVVLDVYLHVWKQAAHYNPHDELPLPWLTRLARQQALDHLRTTGRAPAQMAVREAVQQHRISGALGSLSAEQFQVIEMAYFGGLNYHKIAEELRLPPNIIKKRIGIAVQCLHQKLGEKELRT